MKKVILFIFCAMALVANAQMTETFDSNSWGWTEYSGNEGDAVIKDGVLHLESKKDKANDVQDVLDGICSVAYVPVDPTKGFKLNCEAFMDKVDYDKSFGIVLDYEDDWNCIILLVKRDNAYFYRIKDGKVTRYMRSQFKLGKQKKASLDINVKYIDGQLELRVNDIQALKARVSDINSNGIGFFAFGKVKVDFDNVTISDLF